MPTFRYTAKTRTGQTERGVLEATTEDDAANILQSRDLLITSLEASSAAPATRRAGSIRPSRPRRNRPSTDDMITLSRSMATMLDAGLPLLKSLETITPQLGSRALQDAMREIMQDIRSGSTLRDAVAKHPKIFSTMWVSLIETGEASGQLTKALEQISVHTEKSGDVQRKVVSALIYPCILVVVCLIAIMVFMFKIIPAFSELFTSFGAELPWITRAVLKVSQTTRTYAPIGLATVAGLGFVFWRYTKTDAGKWQIDGLLLRIPILGSLLQSAAVATFATGLGTMIKAGVPLLHGLEIAIASATNSRVAAVLEQMRTGVREGRPLADPLRTTDVFPPMVCQMIAVGEETGKLANMLDEIAKYYEEYVSTLLQRFTSLLEPVMLIVMGGIVGILVVSMYMPIFQMSSAIR